MAIYNIVAFAANSPHKPVLLDKVGTVYETHTHGFQAAADWFQSYTGDNANAFRAKHGEDLERVQVLRDGSEIIFEIVNHSVAW